LLPSSLTSSLHCCCACCAPWWTIWWVQPNQAKKAVLPMMAWVWSACHWIGHRVTDGTAMTSCPWCCPVRNIMALSPGGRRKGCSIYSYVK
jgi:hypothetical protein